MTYPLNPDLEPLQIPPRTPAELLRDFERSVSVYALTSRQLSDVAEELAKHDSPPPDHMRIRLSEASVENEKAKMRIIAKAKIMVATGLTERAAEALDIETAGRL